MAESSEAQSFFGHPIGMRTLFLTEMWERMSYYGMRALLVLFMTSAITAENAGLGLSQLDAQAIYGVYVGFVYFMVVPGGWLADNLLGHQRAVLYGACIIALGHLTLAIPLTQTFFLGLIFVVLGTGLLKGNISTIVGQLYSDTDPRREAGFTVFYMSINIGSTLGFAICGYLGENVGWHWGFGAAGVGMLLGVYQYIRWRHLLGDAGAQPVAMSAARRSRLTQISSIVGVAFVLVLLVLLFGLIEIDPRPFAENFAIMLTIFAAAYFVYLFAFAKLTSEERRNLVLLLLLFVAAAAFWSGFDQSGGSLNIFARDYTDLNFFGFTAPVAWVQFVNPIFVVTFAPMFAAFWMYLGKRNLDPSLPLKFALGTFLMGLSFVVMLAAVAIAMEAAPIGVRWLLLTYLLQTWGELALSPIGLAAFSRYSPKRYAGQMFGLWFLASAIGGVLAGLLGGDAMNDGLDSMPAVFGSMVQYYFALGILLVIAAYFLRAKARSSD
ncbi:MAG TPA: MFS transporter [Gammaproteobacteria bacterium]|nr:MFS transporter [Gammaproteobacteria bacterium]|tara:strand:- start:2656 stop:4140 length:1485 start_codon:yes stop_codon:yes gene_type:complete